MTTQTTASTPPDLATTPPGSTAPPDPGTCPDRGPARGAARTLLARLPRELRFRPRDCVLAVALRGPDRTPGLIARIALPDLLCPSGPELLGRLAGHLVADGASEVVVVVCCDGPDPRCPDEGLRADPGATASRAAAAACAALEDVGPLAVWLVTGDRYLGLGCRDARCCPPAGRPLAGLGDPDPWGTAPPEVLRSRDDVGVVPRATAGRRRSAAAARSRWADARRRAVGSADVLAWRQRSLQTWRTALAAALEAGPDEPADLGPAQVGRIEAALDDTALRDAVVLTLVAPDEDLADALVRHAPLGSSGPWDEEDLDDEDDPGDPDDPEEVVPRATVPAWSPVGGRQVPGGRVAPDPVGAAPDGGRHPGVWRREAGAVSAGVRRALDTLVEPRRAREPDEELVDAACQVLEAVAAHGRAGRQAPALTVLALLAWWCGDGVRARVLVEQALAHDPGHRLAELLDRALALGLPPGWLRRRC